MNEPIPHSGSAAHGTSADPYRLRRFTDAQQPVRDAVHDELRRGQKRSHWMWFFFPQIQGLGHSAIAREFALESLDEARAYIAHPVLGPGLRDATRLVNAVDGRTIHQIFGSPDDMKFRSSMTLFALATADNQVFVDALNKYFHGESDKATLGLLN